MAVRDYESPAMRSFIFLCSMLALVSGQTINGIDSCPTQRPAISFGGNPSETANLSVSLDSQTLDENNILSFPLGSLLELTVSTDEPFVELLVRVSRITDDGDATIDVGLSEGFTFTNLCEAPVAGAFLEDPTGVTSATLGLNVKEPSTTLIIDVTALLAEGDPFGDLYAYNVFVLDITGTAPPAPAETDMPVSAPTDAPAVVEPASVAAIDSCPTQVAAVSSGTQNDMAGLVVSLDGQELDLVSILSFPIGTDLDLSVSSDIPFVELLVRIERFDSRDATGDVVVGGGFAFNDLCPATVAGALLEEAAGVSSATIGLNVQEPATALIIDVTAVLQDGDEFAYGVFVVDIESATVAPAAMPTVAPVVVPTTAPVAATTVAPASLVTVPPAAATTVVPATVPTIAPVVAPTIGPVPAGGAPAITQFVLLNTDTLGQFPLSDGASVTVDPSSGYTVIAETAGDIASAVVFGLDGNDNFKRERFAPFALCGNKDEDTFNDCGFSFDKPIMVTASVEGVEGSAQSITFTLIEADIPSTRVTSLQFVDISTGQSQTIVDGSTLSISGGDSGYTIEALAEGDVGSIVFDFNGESAFNVENLARWFLCRNKEAVIQPCDDFVPGVDYSCTATPYSQDGGQGEAGEGLTVNFSF